jgi:hypothetical protein
MVATLFQIITKSDALAPYRYSFVLMKVGCPVGCSEWLPVTKSLFEECEEGHIIQVSAKRVEMTVDESHKFVAAHKPLNPINWNDKKSNCVSK